jgi:F-type H+-transporting ATPase subunit delta
MATESTTTVARPYAKAIFEQALSTHSLAAWSEMLEWMAAVSLNSDVRELTLSPGYSTEEIAGVFIGVGGDKMSEEGKNLIRLLAENKRLLVLPDIKATFELLKAEQEKSVDVEVRSFEQLSDEQAASLSASLAKRLQRDVTLHVEIDKSLLGGAVIKAGDLVIDGTVRGKLHDLGGSLREF